MHGLGRQFRKEILQNPPLAFALGFLLLVSAVSIFAFLSPYDPDALDVAHKFTAPSLRHWAGTDDLGRDYFTRMLYGGRISLVVGIVAMLLSSAIGITIGLTAGWAGGIVDALLMRLIDLLSSIPWMILVTVISIYLKPGLYAIILVIGLFRWMSIARLVRSETLTIKEREYILYSRSIHQKTAFIITRHILPQALPTIIIAATTGIANAIMLESSLSFLGLGVQQPVSSWGSMLNRAQAVLSTAPYMAVIPGLLIIGTVYSFNKIGSVIQGLADPRSAQKDVLP